MRIERSGRRRNHGRYTICSTKKDFEIAVVDRHMRNQQNETIVKKYIQIDMDNDYDKSGGGEHWHFALIEIGDFAKIMAVVADSIRKNESFAEEIASAFDGNITNIERMKLAVLGVL